MIEFDGYKVADPDALETPAMLVHDSRLGHNIAAVCELAGGGANLLVHVKTHKAAAVVQRQLEAGVAGCKCATLKELEMVLECGAAVAVLAYPLCQRRKAERLAELARQYPQARVCACVSAPEHVETLASVGVDGERLRVLLDVDLGMHRTGVAPGDQAIELARRVAAQPRLELAGLHGYDGHEHLTEPEARAAAAQRHVEELRELAGRLRGEGFATPIVVGGGSFSFVSFARAEGMYGSPGTPVYWDWGYSRMMPDMPFRCAAVVLTQVVDRYPAEGTVTTDLGYKAICGDPALPDRALLLGHRDARLVLQNEEHGVFRWAGALPAVGSYLLAVPGHVCSTTVRHPGSYVVDDDGEVIDYYAHTARDRH